MKLAFVLMTCVFLNPGAWGQTGGEQSTNSGQPSGPMRHEMAPMMQQHMQEMKAQVESMRAKVGQMKSNLPKIKDPTTKQQMQLDTELWDAMVTHLENMQKMMAEHPMGGMHHGPHGPGGPPQPPASPQTQPQ